MIFLPSNQTYTNEQLDFIYYDFGSQSEMTNILKDVWLEPCKFPPKYYFRWRPYLGDQSYPLVQRNVFIQE